MGENPMHTASDHYRTDSQAVRALKEANRLLAEELRAVRRKADRRGRRLWLMSLAAATALALSSWSARYFVPTAQAQESVTSALGPLTADDLTARREPLLAELPAEIRQQLEGFERQVDWLTRYMQTFDERTAGAVVALMLYRMSQNMDAMPVMEQQMRTMSAQMGALPAIVAELNQINAKMTVITGTMDSTMGRAGRVMPWMPFSP